MLTDPLAAPAVATDLVLVEAGGKGMDPAPNEVTFGAIRLGSWQLHPVHPLPETFGGHDGYLIRINYQLDVEPELPAPSWFEVGFTFSVAAAASDGAHSADSGVVVLDVLPHTVRRQCPETSWRLGRHLNFAPDLAGGAGDIRLPVTSPDIDVFGLGGSEVRWRHSSENGTRTRPGSYVCWLMLLVPSGCSELTVAMSARFDVASDEAADFRPVSRPGQFQLNLERLRGPRPAIEPAADSGEPAGAARIVAPRVFICYGHDDPAHIKAVMTLATLLMRCGIDAHMDRWDLHTRRDWYTWVLGEVTKADFVLVVASASCKAVGDGNAENKKNRGLQAEMALLRDLLQDDRDQWVRKLLPVILPNGSVDQIPLFLQPRNADHYKVDELTIAGADGLLRTITKNPRFVRPTRATSRSPSVSEMAR